MGYVSGNQVESGLN